MIEDTDTTECPVSMIDRHPELFELVQLVWTMRHVRELSGAILFGPDAGEWPSRYYEAVNIIAVEDIRVKNAMAEMRDRA